MKRFIPAGVVVLSGLLSGCAGWNDSQFPNLKPKEARALSARLTAARDAELLDDLRAAFAQHSPRNVLVLSGGDASGAFGCGVLAGWRSAPDPRPTFDIVTGVSTGALMAVSAFLGQEQDDATLRQVYTNTRDRDIYDGPLTPGRPNSLFGTAPLERLIGRYVNDDVIRRVAAAHRQGRRLYVATVGLTEGRMVIWPLSRIAEGAVAAERESLGAGHVQFDRFRRILLAASAIPVVFPPVELDGDLHADAGLHAAMFLTDAMLGSSGDDGKNARTVYAIMNGPLRADPSETPDDLLHIGIRSLALYVDGLQFASLRTVALTAAAHRPAWQFRYLGCPPDLKDEATPNPFKGMFDPKAMRKFYEAGEAAGHRDASAWSAGTPPDDGEASVLRAAK